MEENKKEYKKCCYCKEEKSILLFRKDNQKKDGLDSRCKSCLKKPTIVVAWVEPTHKVCVDCKVNKEYSLYHKKTKNGRITVQSRCKDCQSAYKKNRYWSNRDVELAKMTQSRLKPENVLKKKEYYKKNKEDYIKRYKKYMDDEEKKKAKLESSKKRYQENKEQIRARHKRNYEKPETKEKIRLSHHVRKETDVQYVIRRRLRFRLRNIVKSLKNNKYKLMSSIELLGCDMNFFKSYIESKFVDGMSWERLSEIHLDHIKPCVKFDLTKIEEQKICFHYTNIQPLWAKDNLIKNSKFYE